MKKALLALAVTSAFAGSAFAQSSSVTLYGIVDMGMVHESGSNGSVNKLTSGVASQSRLGFKGMEDLGGGLSALFTMEAGFQADTGAQLTPAGTPDTRLFGRQSFVGLKSNELGTVTAGRQYALVYETLRDVADPFAVGTTARANNLMATAGTRTDNMLKYVSPSFSGLTAKATYGFGEVVGSTSASRSYGLGVDYANGPVAASVAYNNQNNALATDRVKNTLVAGSYDFGVAKANLGYGINKGVGAADSRDMLVGVTVPFGATKVMASYVRKNDRSAADADARQIGVGVTHSLSKRTDLYTSYARISNKNGAAYTVGNASEVGTGDRAFAAGIRHTF